MLARRPIDAIAIFSIVFAVTFAVFWQSRMPLLFLPVMVIILAAAISHIDIAYEKAAASLGAGPLRVLWNVTLPLSMPGILSGTVTIFAWTLSAFATPQLVGGGKVNMISNMVYQLGFSNFDFPFAAVLSMVALVLIFAILGLMNLGMRRLESVGVH